MPARDELYTRQAEIGLTTPNNVTVVGVGGIGSWVAIDLAMSGVPNLFLFDPDTLELSNLNRLPYCSASIGRPKVEVCADWIRGLRPDCNVVPIQERFGGLLLNIQVSTSNWIVDCTDSPKTQFEVYKKCKEHGVKFVRAGYDGTHGTVAGSVSGWIRTDVEEEAYAVNPSWVVPSQVFAALAVAKVLKYHDQEVSCDLSEIGVPAPTRNKSGRLTARCSQTPTRTRRRG